MHASTTGSQGKNCSRYTPHQRSLLEAAFASNFYPTKTTLLQVAEQTGLGEERVRRWLINKRVRTKRAKMNETLDISE